MSSVRQEDVIQCENGHFYDKKQYKSCPHCNGSQFVSESSRFMGRKNKTSYDKGDSVTEEIVINQKDKLKEVVKKASASNEEKTIGYFNKVAGQQPDEKRYENLSDPVVGWIVCIKGYHFGKSFFIYAGQNSIGRSTENRIAITDDGSISRIKHAMIVYEPKKRDFYLQPGDSSGITYLNDNLVTSVQKLTSYDVIELGDSKFMFVPFCGESFSWEEIDKKEKEE